MRKNAIAEVRSKKNGPKKHFPSWAKDYPPISNALCNGDPNDRKKKLSMPLSVAAVAECHKIAPLILLPSIF